MAARGDVLRLRVSLGFGSDSSESRVLVVQASGLNTTLATLLVIPLEAALPIYARVPFAVPISGPEAGLPHDAVAMVQALTSLSRTRMEPLPVGQALPTTMTQIEQALCDIMEL